MKKLILITFFILNSSFLIFANDRLEFSRFEEMSDRYSDRLACASENIDYTSAVRPEASRVLMVELERNERNPDYEPSDTRFLVGKMADIVSAQSDVPELSISQTRELIWNQAVAQYPDILIYKLNAFPHTFIWYQFKELDEADVATSKELLNQIIKLFTR